MGLQTPKPKTQTSGSHGSLKMDPHVPFWRGTGNDVTFMTCDLEKKLWFPLTSECRTCGNDPYQTAEGKRKSEKGHGGYISVIGFTSHILKKNTGISIDVRMLHMQNRPLSDCRGEKKGRKGTWRLYFRNWLYTPYFKKKHWDFHWRQNVAHVGSTLIRLQRGKEKGGKGAWRPYIFDKMGGPWAFWDLWCHIYDECFTSFVNG